MFVYDKLQTMVCVVRVGMVRGRGRRRLLLVVMVRGRRRLRWCRWLVVVNAGGGCWGTGSRAPDSTSRAWAWRSAASVALSKHTVCFSTSQIVVRVVWSCFVCSFIMFMYRDKVEALRFVGLLHASEVEVELQMVLHVLAHQAFQQSHGTTWARHQMLLE